MYSLEQTLVPGIGLDVVDIEEEELWSQSVTPGQGAVTRLVLTCEAWGPEGDGRG